MGTWHRVCAEPPPAASHFAVYQPATIRLSPPDGLNTLRTDYFVNNRAACREVDFQGVRCPGGSPYREENATFWDFNLGGGIGSSVSTYASGNAVPWAGGVFRWGKLHGRSSTRFGYEWDIMSAPPMSLYDKIAETAGFNPSSIVADVGLTWDFTLGVKNTGLASAPGFYYFAVNEDGNTSPVSVTFSANFGTRVVATDEDGQRPILAGDLGGTPFWTRNVTLVIPGATRFFNGVGDGAPFIWDRGSANVLADITADCQACMLNTSVLYFGPKLLPPFAEPTARKGRVTMPGQPQRDATVGYYRSAVTTAVIRGFVINQ